MRPAKNSPSLNSSALASAVSAQQIEAARYAIIRRLAPALRHHMVRYLQPISLIYGVMDHKLASPGPDLHTLRTHADKMNALAKAALAQCIDIGTWLAPTPGVVMGVGEGVMECASLLATTLHFRGFQLVNEVGDMPVRGAQSVFRMVLSAVLLQVTDALTQPATLTLRATADAAVVTLQLQISPNPDDDHVERYDDGYRKLLWSDVQALAAAEGVRLSRQEKRVTISIPIEPAAI